VEDIGYGLVKFKNGVYGKLFATSICDEPPGTVWMRISGSKGEIYSALPWLYTIDFSLHDKNEEEELRDGMEQHLASLQEPGLQDWNDTHDRRVLRQMYDIIQAVQQERDVTIDPESCGESMKILNGIHWGGWNHTEAFKKWAYTNFDLPKPSKAGALPTVDDSRYQNWHGGQLVETLVNFVQDPEPTLKAPFV
jgi:hypothetical protein